MTSCALCALFRLLKGWAGTPKSGNIAPNRRSGQNPNAIEDIEMAINTGRALRHAALGGCALVALAGCQNGTDFDIREGFGNRFDTTESAINATRDRPMPDARGVISYPNYQVAVARRGDTVASVAARIGADAQDLATYNGLQPDTELRVNEVLALRAPVSVLPNSNGGFATAPGAVDITALAQGAIDSADAPAALPSVVASPGPEPVRHQVQRGETAFTIARLYNVSVRSLADWNGLDSSFAVREGQFLLIPVAEAPAPLSATGVPTATAVAAAPLATSNPGEGSPTPTPPSATQPLPQEQTRPAAEPVEIPPAPVLTPSPSSAQSSGQFVAPVSGPIIRDYAKGKNESVVYGVSAGTSVKAADAGTVRAITKNTDGQSIVVVRHSGELVTVYTNVDNISVKNGDRVTRGQSIAKVAGGSAEFLGFSVCQGFDCVDPTEYLN